MSEHEGKASASERYRAGLRGEQADTRERRQSPSERYHELSMAWATRPLAAPEHSLDITRNAKGEWQYSLTVRGADLVAVLESAFEAVEQLEAKYPRAGATLAAPLVDAGTGGGGPTK